MTRKKPELVNSFTKTFIIIRVESRESEMSYIETKLSPAATPNVGGMFNIAGRVPSMYYTVAVEPGNDFKVLYLSDTYYDTDKENDEVHLLMKGWATYTLDLKFRDLQPSKNEILEEEVKPKKISDKFKATEPMCIVCRSKENVTISRASGYLTCSDHRGMTKDGVDKMVGYKPFETFIDDLKETV